MSARERLDAAHVAERMNARPLLEGTDGGFWEPGLRWFTNGWCEKCDARLKASLLVSSVGHFGSQFSLCLPCAVSDCERAEAEHRAADPHCTCNDCIAHEGAVYE